EHTTGGTVNVAQLIQQFLLLEHTSSWRTAAPGSCYDIFRISRPSPSRSLIRPVPIVSCPVQSGRQSQKSSEYGKCAYCKEYNTHEAWCQTCDPDLT
ncbi:4723_t:CDS:2, partial [Ambispora leptoticha]